jgi:hypothetical protein
VRSTRQGIACHDQQAGAAAAAVRQPAVRPGDAGGLSASTAATLTDAVPSSIAATSSGVPFSTTLRARS